MQKKAAYGLLFCVRDLSTGRDRGAAFASRLAPTLIAVVRTKSRVGASLLAKIYEAQPDSDCTNAINVHPAEGFNLFLEVAGYERLAAIFTVHFFSSAASRQRFLSAYACHRPPIDRPIPRRPLAGERSVR
ncbi:hypothetical protein EMIT0P253_140112 [Pseudomonas sp. IT-P253]